MLQSNFDEMEGGISERSTFPPAAENRRHGRPAIEDHEVLTLDRMY